ncbi:MAG: hypothetical protein LBU32_19740 [Clostridiales bacterium]|jgi:hypothetical protein|nr:hypothetical protein [Clostridiales bacterium]
MRIKIISLVALCLSILPGCSALSLSAGSVDNAGETASQPSGEEKTEELERLQDAIRVLADNLSDSAGDESDKESFQRVRFVISGYRGGNYEALGDDVLIGSFFMKDDVLPLFTIGLKAEDGTSITLAMENLNITSKSEQMGSLLSTVEYTGESWEDSFTSQYRMIAYDASENSDDSRSYMTLSKIEKLGGGYLHLVGTFRFKACNLPDPVPEAAILDAFKNPHRSPPYNPEFLGTTDIEASGDFDITMLAQLLGWQ